MDRPSLKDRIRYYVDLFMSWSPLARFFGLFLVSLSLVTAWAILAELAAPADAEFRGDFLESMWWALSRVADAGTFTGDKGTLIRLIAFAASLSGIMVVAVLIGLVSTAVADKIESLRQGKSPVIDSNHTLILGFSDKVFPILRELREANASRPHAAIVILSLRDKIEVEDAIRDRMGSMNTTRVVVRQGSPFAVHDLQKVGAGRARSIIVLSSDVSESDDADMNAIKTLLALRRVPGALKNNHAVVELTDVDRIPVVERLGAGGVEVVAMRDTLARLMVQTSRQNGLAGVYRDLLSFDGSELYFKNFPELAGVAFADVQSVLRAAIPLGIRRPNAAPELNPPPGTTLRADDEILVLAEDDDAFSVDRSHPLPSSALQPSPSFRQAQRRPERILICGFRSDLARLVNDFDQYVAPGSELLLMPGPNHAEDFGRVAAALPAAEALNNLTVRVIAGDPTSPPALKAVVAMNLDSILHLADDTLEPGEADARTVISLLMMRDFYLAAPAGKRPRMISEILDARTKELVSDDDATDFVVSSEITSMLMAQLSEQRELARVFADLFDPAGNELYLKSVERYIPTGEPVSWLSVHAAAQRYGEVALGCFRSGTAPLLNPNQAALLRFRPGDKLVVLAENDQENSIPQPVDSKRAA